jgi:branched-chain amino acid transport system substrate-binding protein
MRRLSAKTFRLAAMTTASAAVAACGLSSTAPSNSLLAGATGQPITIGVSEPLSGPQQAQGFAPDGQASKIGYELWASDVNSHGGLLGRPVRLVFLNDKGDIGLTKANYRTLITQKKVNLTLAPFSSLLTAQAAGPVTEHYGYVLPAGSAAANQVYQLKDHFLFSTNVPVKNQMMPLAQWLVSRPGHPVTAAYPMVDDPFADPPVQTVQAFFENHGIRTVYAQTYPANVTTRALTADAKAVAQRKPGIVVLGSIAVSTVQAFVREFISANWTPKVFIASSGPDQGQAFLNAVGTGNANGIMVPNAWWGSFPNALSHLMVQNYIARYGGTADGINADVAEAYSAGQVLAAGVTGARSLNQQKIASWLHNSSVQTVVGQVAWTADGENRLAVKSAAIFQWQPGPGGVGADFIQVLPSGIGTKPIIAWSG